MRSWLPDTGPEKGVPPTIDRHLTFSKDYTDRDRGTWVADTEI